MSGELAFSSRELNAMKAAQEAHMMDRCKILAWSVGSADAFGRKSATYTAGSEIACGFNFANRTVEVQGESDVVLIDGHVRLPSGTTVSSKDRIRITKRFGSAVTNVDYEIIGEPRLGPSGLRLDIRKVPVG